MRKKYWKYASALLLVPSMVLAQQDFESSSSDEEVFELDKLVVEGYTTSKKKDLTGAVSQIDGEELDNGTSTRIDQALQGQVPGLTIISGSSDPDSEMKINIRGTASIYGDDRPLIIIDGVKSQPSDLRMVKPEDIASVNVLKDASSAAIYGVEAASGVILIETKKGSVGEPKISASVEMGYTVPYNIPEPMNFSQFLQHTKSQYDDPTEYPAWVQNYESALTSSDPADQAAIAKYFSQSNNWLEEIYNPGLTVQSNFSVSAGNEDMEMFLSGSYLDQEGITLNSGKTVATARINTKVTKGFVQFGENISFQNKIVDAWGGQDGITRAIWASPNIPYYDEEMSGGYGQPVATWFEGLNYGNPVSQYMLDTNVYRENVLMGNVFLNLRYEELLSWQTRVNFRTSNYNRQLKQPERQKAGIATSWTGASTIVEDWSNTTEINPETFLTLNAQTDMLTAKLLVGASAEQKVWKSISGKGTNFEEGLASLNAAPDREAVTGGYDKKTGLSQFGRLDMDIMEKYLLAFNYRLDGSSLFADGNRWGFFPGLSAGWRISNEEFMSDISETLTNLKLRFGWGILGRKVEAATWYTELNSTIGYVFGNQHATGVALTRLENEDITWEKVHQLNLGVDFGILDDFLNVTVDAYQRQSEDMILQVQLPMYSGITGGGWQNIGTLRNRGIEVSATHAEQYGDFSHSISANVALQENEVTNTGIEDTIYYGNSITTVGSPIASFYGYQADGLFNSESEIDKDLQPSAEPGDVRYVNLNTVADTLEDSNGNDSLVQRIDGKDRTIIGNPLPWITFGLNYSGEFKGFDFSMFWQGVGGNDILNLTTTEWASTHQKFNQTTEVLNAWTEQNTNTDVPRAAGNDANGNNWVSSRLVESGTYLRLKTLSVGYRLPITEELKVRFYASAENLLTITSYSGLNPDISGGNNPLNAGVDFIGLDGTGTPPSRVYAAGISINF